MFVVEEFQFEDDAPSLPSLLQKVTEMSGLSDITLDGAGDNENSYSLGHPLFNKRSFLINRYDKRICLTHGWQDPWYLLDITIGALVMLGGRMIHPATGEILTRSWVTRPWEEIKANYHKELDWKFFVAIDIDEEIQFENGSPPIQEILDRVKNMSGLSEITLVAQEGGVIFDHPAFGEEKAFLLFNRQGQKTTLIQRPRNDPNYLLEITLSVLTDLGGVYKGVLKSFTREKWQVVKNLYVDES
jgi:hypothetical protein